MTKVRKNNEEEELEGTSEVSKFVVVTEHTMVSHTYRIWLDDVIREPQYYRQALEVLETASENDYVSIHVDTIGGSVNTAQKLINAIRNTDANVLGVLENRAYSAGSMILLACPRILVKPYATLMAHSVSFGVGGDLQKMLNSAEFVKRETDRLVDDVYTGFLTSDEIDSVKAGEKEIWLSDYEILERLDSLAEFKLALREAEKIADQIDLEADNDVVESPPKKRTWKTK